VHRVLLAIAGLAVAAAVVFALGSPLAPEMAHAELTARVGH